MDAKQFQERFQRIYDEVNMVVAGQEAAVRLLLTAIFAEGHVILTGVPGLGRTLIAETVGTALGLKVNRIQFTPDMLPTDVTGTEVIDMVNGAHQHRFIKGPVFTNLVLADEINRSPARTQSALLECMQEKQVTISGHRFVLEKPFQVIATQNTLDTEGVYPLPEAQLDRFMMQIEIKYPTREAELEILAMTTSVFHRDVKTITNAEEVVEMQRFARVIPVSQTVKEYTARLVQGSRMEDEEKKSEVRVKSKKRNWWGSLRKDDAQDRVARFLRWGASPRAGQSLLRASKVSAIVKGRSYVTREDINEAAYPILAHRLIPDHRAGAKGLKSHHVVDGLIKEVGIETAPQTVSSRVRSLLLAMTE